MDDALLVGRDFNAGACRISRADLRRSIERDLEPVWGRMVGVVNPYPSLVSATSRDGGSPHHSDQGREHESCDGAERIAITLAEERGLSV